MLAPESVGPDEVDGTLVQAISDSLGIGALADEVAGKQAELGLTGRADQTSMRVGTNHDKALTAKSVYDAAAFVTLTDAATIAVNMSLGNNFTVTLAGNRTLGNPTNMKIGQCGVIQILQDATGTRTLAYGTAWKFGGGTAPVLSTAASARDMLTYFVLPGSIIYAALVEDVK